MPGFSPASKASFPTPLESFTSPGFRCGPVSAMCVIADVGLAHDFVEAHRRAAMETGEPLWVSRVATGIYRTSGFMAPEMLLGVPYTEAVDVFSLGVMMYLLLFGYMPFSGKTEQEMNCAVVRDPLMLPSWHCLDEPTVDLLKRVRRFSP